MSSNCNCHCFLCQVLVQSVLLFLAKLSEKCSLMAISSADAFLIAPRPRRACGRHFDNSRICLFGMSLHYGTSSARARSVIAHFWRQRFALLCYECGVSLLYPHWLSTSLLSLRIGGLTMSISYLRAVSEVPLSFSASLVRSMAASKV